LLFPSTTSVHERAAVVSSVYKQIKNDARVTGMDNSTTSAVTAAAATAISVAFSARNEGTNDSSKSETKIAATVESSKSGRTILSIPNVKADAIMLALQAIYVGQATGTWTGDLLSGIIDFAVQYNVKSLHRIIAKFVHSGFHPLSFEQSVQLFDEFPSELKKEKADSLRFFANHMDHVLVTETWLQFKTDTVKMIVQCPFLRVNEMHLFRSVLRWASAQCKRAGKDDTAANKQAVLAGIIEHIRFPLFDSLVLIEHVQPTNVLTSSQMISLFTFAVTKMPSSDMPFPYMPRYVPLAAEDRMKSNDSSENLFGDMFNIGDRVGRELPTLPAEYYAARALTATGTASHATVLAAAPPVSVVKKANV